MPLIIIAVIALIVLIYLWQRRRTSPPAPRIDDGKPDSDTFEFTPDMESVTPTAARRVRVEAPAQRVRGAQRRLVVEAQPLPRLADLEAPRHKGIDALQVLFFNPLVRLADTDEPVYDFTDPLTVTVFYTADDAAMTAKDMQGKPRLAIITGYQSEDGWRFERLGGELQPDPDTGGGTCTVRVKTLQPKDPMWIGNP